MKEHERCHISADTQFECTGCGQNFFGTDAFRQHPCSRSLLKSDHSSEQTKKSPVSGPTLGEEEEVDVTGEDVFNCFACSEQFSTKSSLLEHQNDHHPKVQLKCGICGQTFKHRQDLIQHERTHLERDARATVKKKKKTRLSCFKCPTMFDTVQEMALHMKSHCVQDYLHYRCDMCYRSFSQLSLLKQHHESHVGQVVYECTECDKAFAFLHLLEEHQLTHAGPSK
jgi:KRAB domain-containing zinc finger protein